MIGRDPSSAPIAYPNARFSSPIRFSAGTATSSSTISPVGEPRTPSFDSILPIENPRRVRSTTNALTPW